MAQKTSSISGLGLLISAVLGIIIIGGVVWSMNGNVSKKQPGVAHHTVSTPMTMNPYADWKSYCDTTRKVCFKYPQDWVISSEQTTTKGHTSLTVTLRSPDNGVIGSYASTDTRPEVTMPFYTVMQRTLAPAFTVVGGYFPGSTIRPEYAVVDTARTTTLEDGHETDFANPLLFTLPVNQTTAHLELFAQTPAAETVSAAQQWFSTSDAATAQLVAESFTTQP